MSQFCAKCGAPLPAGSQFCPKCGAAVVVAPPLPPPPVVTPTPTPTPAGARTPVTAAPPPHGKPRPKSTIVMWVPIAIIGLALLAWLVLAGLPFGEPDRSPRPQQREVDVVQEGTPATVPAPATITERPSSSAEIERPPLVVPQPMPQPMTPVPMPPTMTPMPPSPTPRPMPQTPVPVPRTPAAVPQPPAQRPAETARAGQLSESEAMSTLRGYITSRDDYGVSSECLVISSQGYQNVGYTMQAFDRCDNESVGRWRVDARNGDVFRQRSDGRFLRP